MPHRPTPSENWDEDFEFNSNPPSPVASQSRARAHPVMPSPLTRSTTATSTSTPSTPQKQRPLQSRTAPNTPRSVRTNTTTTAPKRDETPRNAQVSTTTTNGEKRGVVGRSGVAGPSTTPSRRTAAPTPTPTLAPAPPPKPTARSRSPSEENWDEDFEDPSSASSALAPHVAISRASSSAIAPQQATPMNTPRKGGLAVQVQVTPRKATGGPIASSSSSRPPPQVSAVGRDALAGSPTAAPSSRLPPPPLLAAAAPPVPPSIGVIAPPPRTTSPGEENWDDDFEDPADSPPHSRPPTSSNTQPNSATSSDIPRLSTSSSRRTENWDEEFGLTGDGEEAESEVEFGVVSKGGKTGLADAPSPTPYAERGAPPLAMVADGESSDEEEDDEEEEYRSAEDGHVLEQDHRVADVQELDRELGWVGPSGDEDRTVTARNRHTLASTSAVTPASTSNASPHSNTTPTRRRPLSLQPSPPPPVPPLPSFLTSSNSIAASTSTSLSTNSQFDAPDSAPPALPPYTYNYNVPPRSPAVSTFSIPASSREGHSSSIGHASHLALRRTFSGGSTGLGSLPPSPPLHHSRYGAGAYNGRAAGGERRRLRKKSRPPPEGVFELEEIGERLAPSAQHPSLLRKKTRPSAIGVGGVVEDDSEGVPPSTPPHVASTSPTAVPQTPPPNPNVSFSTPSSSHNQPSGLSTPPNATPSGKTASSSPLLQRIGSVKKWASSAAAAGVSATSGARKKRASTGPSEMLEHQRQKEMLDPMGERRSPRPASALGTSLGFGLSVNASQVSFSSPPSAQANTSGGGSWFFRSSPTAPTGESSSQSTSALALPGGVAELKKEKSRDRLRFLPAFIPDSPSRSKARKSDIGSSKGVVFSPPPPSGSSSTSNSNSRSPSTTDLTHQGSFTLSKGKGRPSSIQVVRQPSFTSVAPSTQSVGRATARAFLSPVVSADTDQADRRDETAKESNAPVEGLGMGKLPGAGGSRFMNGVRRISLVGRHKRTKSNAGDEPLPSLPPSLSAAMVSSALSDSRSTSGASAFGTGTGTGTGSRSSSAGSGSGGHSSLASDSRRVSGSGSGRPSTENYSVVRASATEPTIAGATRVLERGRPGSQSAPTKLVSPTLEVTPSAPLPNSTRTVPSPPSTPQKSNHSSIAHNISNNPRTPTRTPTTSTGIGRSPNVTSLIRAPNSPSQTASLGRSATPVAQLLASGSGTVAQSASSGSPVPRRNSLGDLKIPARISKAQSALRRDLWMVKEFAASVEQLKELQAMYLTLVSQTRHLADEPDPSIVSQRVPLLSFARPSSRSSQTRARFNPASSSNEQRSIVSSTQLAGQLDALESKYKITWECAELLIEIGGGSSGEASLYPAPPPPLSSGTTVAAKVNRERAITLTGDEVHPPPSSSSGPPLASPPDRDPAHWRASTGRHDLSQRQLVLLKEMLNSPDTVNSPPDDLPEDVPVDSNTWRWADSEAMSSTITLPSEENSIVVGSVGRATSPVIYKKRRGRGLGMSGIRDMLKSFKKNGALPTSPPLPPVPRVVGPAASLSPNAGANSSLDHHGLPLPPSRHVQHHTESTQRQRQRGTSTGPELTISTDNMQPPRPAFATTNQAPYPPKSSPRRPSLASIFRLGSKTKTANAAAASTDNFGTSTGSGSRDGDEDEDWDRLEDSTSEMAGASTTSLSMAVGGGDGTATVRGKKKKTRPYLFSGPSSARRNNPQRSASASRSSIWGSSPDKSQNHIPPAPPPAQDATIHPPPHQRVTNKLSNVVEDMDATPSRHSRPSTARTNPPPSPRRSVSGSRRDLTPASLRSAAPPLLAEVSQAPSHAADPQLAMTPENIKPLLENAVEVKARCGECIEAMRRLMVSRAGGDLPAPPF